MNSDRPRPFESIGVVKILMKIGGMVKCHNFQILIIYNFSNDERIPTQF